MALHQTLTEQNFSCDLGFPAVVFSSSPATFRTQLAESDEKRALDRTHLLRETFLTALADRDLSWQNDLYARLVVVLCSTVDGGVVPLDRVEGLCSALGLNPLIVDHPLRVVMRVVVHEIYWLRELSQDHPEIADYAPFSPAGGWTHDAIADVSSVAALLREHILTDTEPGTPGWANRRPRALVSIALNVAFSRGSDSPLWREGHGAIVYDETIVSGSCPQITGYETDPQPGRQPGCQRHLRVIDNQGRGRSITLDIQPENAWSVNDHLRLVTRRAKSLSDRETTYVLNVGLERDRLCRELNKLTEEANRSHLNAEQLTIALASAVTERDGNQGPEAPVISEPAPAYSLRLQIDSDSTYDSEAEQRVRLDPATTVAQGFLPPLSLPVPEIRQLRRTIEAMPDHAAAASAASEIQPAPLPRFSEAVIHPAASAHPMPHIALRPLTNADPVRFASTEAMQADNTRAYLHGIQANRQKIEALKRELARAERSVQANPRNPFVVMTSSMPGSVPATVSVDSRQMPMPVTRTQTVRPVPAVTRQTSASMPVSQPAMSHMPVLPSIETLMRRIDRVGDLAAEANQRAAEAKLRHTTLFELQQEALAKAYAQQPPPASPVSEPQPSSSHTLSHTPSAAVPPPVNTPISAAVPAPSAVPAPAAPVPAAVPVVGPVHSPVPSAQTVLPDPAVPAVTVAAPAAAPAVEPAPAPAAATAVEPVPVPAPAPVPAPVPAASVTMQPQVISKMPIFHDFDGRTGQEALQWLTNVQRYLKFAQPALPGQEVTFILAKLKGDAVHWFESTLGIQYGVHGLGCPLSVFEEAFMERYVTPDCLERARTNLEQLKQGTTEIRTFNERFNAAVHQLELVPGLVNLSDGDISFRYLRALNDSLLVRLSKAMPDMAHKHVYVLQAQAVQEEQGRISVQQFRAPAKGPVSDKPVEKSSSRKSREKAKSDRSSKQSSAFVSTGEQGAVHSQSNKRRRVGSRGRGGGRTAPPAASAPPQTTAHSHISGQDYNVLPAAVRQELFNLRQALGRGRGGQHSNAAMQAPPQQFAFGPAPVVPSPGSAPAWRPGPRPPATAPGAGWGQVGYDSQGGIGPGSSQQWHYGPPGVSHSDNFEAHMPFMQGQFPMDAMFENMHVMPAQTADMPVHADEHHTAQHVERQSMPEDEQSSAVPEPPAVRASAQCTPGMQDANDLTMLFTVYAERTLGSARKGARKKINCLVDSGSTHSFLSSRYAKCFEPSGAQAQVHMANGAVQSCQFGHVKLQFGGCQFVHNVGLMHMQDTFDMVLGSDWLNQYRAQLNYDAGDSAHEDRRCVKFVEPKTGDAFSVPVPSHHRAAMLNSVVWNTVADIQARAKSGQNDADESPVTHMFMVYVSAPVMEPDFMPAVSAMQHDPHEPHVVDAFDDHDYDQFDIPDAGVRVETESLRAEIQEVVNEFKDRFPSDIPPGLPPDREGIAHAIPLKPGEHNPPARKAFRLTPAEKLEVEQRIAYLLEQGWIQPSTSPYGAPVLFVGKKDGGLRMCIDYRPLNKQTVKNRYPIPRIDDLLDCLHGAKYFSSLDLQQAYYQIKLLPDDIPKTAFITHKGLFEYRVLAMGLSNAPATFQALMNRVLGKYLGKFCLVYMDDILVYSQTPVEHVQHLRIILQCFREHELYCKLSKSCFAMKEVPFLGVVVGEEGVKPNPKKVQILQDWPVPQTPHDVKCFLGLAQYFAKFIPGYATMATCLHALTKPSAKHNFVWTDACQRAFQDIKHAMASEPVLALPDASLPFEVVTDASQTGIGAVLLQEGRPIAFAGRQMNPAETRYSTTDQELLAVIFALQQWRCYLQGAQHDFLLVTDHHPNTYLGTKPTLSRRQARWSEKLQEYHFEWQYRPGKHNVADPVSRSPALLAALQLEAVGLNFDWQPKPSCMHLGLAAAMIEQAEFCDHVMGNAKYVAQPEQVMCAVQTRAQLQQQDVPAAPVQQTVSAEPARKRKSAQPEKPKPFPASYTEHDAVKLSLLPDLIEAYGKDPQMGDPRDLSVKHKYLTAKDGVWYHKGVIAVPDSPSVKRAILTELHDSPVAGHGGEWRTVQLVRRYFWWPSLERDCRQFVKGCMHCQRNKAQTRRYAGQLQQHEVPSQKWLHLAMDFITNLPVTARGHNMIMVVVDVLTKMAHFVPCQMTDGAEAIAHFHIENVFRLHGWPRAFLTDRDGRFLDAFFRAVSSQLGTAQIMSTTHHHEHACQDHAFERMNRVLEETLRHYVSDRMDDWDTVLLVAEFAINNAFQRSISTTPFFLNYGYHPAVSMEDGDQPPS